MDWNTFSGKVRHAYLGRTKWFYRFDRSVWSLELRVCAGNVNHYIHDKNDPLGGTPRPELFGDYRVYGLVWFRRAPQTKRHLSLSELHSKIKQDGKREFDEAFAEWNQG